MPKFQVRNKRTKMVLGDVEVADPAMVLDALAAETGTSIEDVAHALGASVEEAKAALDIVEVRAPQVRSKVMRPVFAPLPRRRLFG